MSACPLAALATTPARSATAAPRRSPPQQRSAPRARPLQRVPRSSSSRARLAAAAVDQAEEGEEEYGEACSFAFVTADNKSHPDCTVLEVEMSSFPGLLRNLAWVLNGLDMVAQNAVIRTSPEGAVHNTFWLRTRLGKKLPDHKAQLLAERVRDFMMGCSSAAKQGAPACEFESGPVAVSNSQHPEYTLVSVSEDRPSPGFLLDVASVLSGLNHDIKQALIEKQEACVGDWVSSSDDCGSVFQFWLTNREGKKLDYGEIKSLCFVLSRCLGFRTHPTVPPNEEVLVVSR